MRGDIASHRRPPKPDFCANRGKLIREAYSARAIRRRMPRTIKARIRANLKRRSETEFALEQIVHRLRIGLAAG
jgi:hypothetical protein